MPVPSVHCEAKKVAYRQTKDGLVVSFVIHPNDMPDALAVAPLGTRYMLAMAAIGDDEQVVEMTAHGAPQEPPAGTAGRDAVQGADGGSGGHPSSATRLDTSAASQRGREQYFKATPEQRALIRAGRLPQNDRFRAWLAELWGVSMISEETAEEYIRDRCCNGGSRRLIAEDPACREAYLTLETDYYAATGQMAEVR